MDGAVTREEAEAGWRRDLEQAEASDEHTWPMDITTGMSEFERLTLVTEILMPVRSELMPGAGETREPDSQPAGDGGGDDGGTGGEEDADAPGVNHLYPVILAAAAACSRWLKEDLAPGLRAGGPDFDTPMTLDPAADIDRWARERAGPLTEEPADDDIESWLHRVDLRTAGTLPEESAPREEWSEAVGHGMALVREAIHRLTLARLHMRAGDPALLESNVALQVTGNLYRVIVWLASTLQAWGLALVRLHNAFPQPHNGH